MSRSVRQDYDKLRNPRPNLTQQNIEAACHECGATGSFKASASRGGETPG